VAIDKLWQRVFSPLRGPDLIMDEYPRLVGLALGLALTAAPQLVLSRARLLVKACLMRQLCYCPHGRVSAQTFYLVIRFPWKETVSPGFI